MHHWVCRITPGMSWQVTRVFEPVVWLQSCCCFLGCHKREGLHVLMAEMETLHLSQNSLHMDLLKGCFYVPLQKSALSLCCWVVPWSRSHCCQLGVTPLKPEYKMQLLATFTYSTPYSIICPSFLSTIVGISLQSTSFVKCILLVLLEVAKHRGFFLNPLY